ncbi:hypothetical protein LXA43DRAFT_1060712 [Ganoderma leucocontextum]|nr:hypothetical protein LXA43DRAFT_1060712 [Ganoderma leucocontextum]
MDDQTGGRARVGLEGLEGRMLEAGETGGGTARGVSRAITREILRSWRCWSVAQRDRATGASGGREDKARQDARDLGRRQRLSIGLRCDSTGFHHCPRDGSALQIKTFYLDRARHPQLFHGSGYVDKSLRSKLFTGMLRGYQAWIKLNGMLPIQPAYDRGERRMDVVKTDTGTRPGNLLARTAADGGWVFLAVDSAHDWRLLTGEAGMGLHTRGPGKGAGEHRANKGVGGIPEGPGLARSRHAFREGERSRGQGVLA